ncbi:alpha/beta hydrolase [Lysobacter soli]|nr:alpha/beta hydrolase [Lysobacter soli]MDG2517140.1 alpha/beta hydrolase [Lysobacter soli]
MSVDATRTRGGIAGPGDRAGAACRGRRELILSAIAAVVACACSSGPRPETYRTFCLLHGSTHDARGWQWLARELRANGHHVIAPRLPFEDETTTAARCAAVVGNALDEAGGHRDVCVLAHSISGLILPLVASHPRVGELCYLAAAVARPGYAFREQFEQAKDMYFDDWIQRGSRVHSDPDVARHFLYHDCPPDVFAATSAMRIQFAARRLWTDRFALTAHPDVPTRYIAPTLDRVFQPQWMVREARETLAVPVVEIDAGHAPHLSVPRRLSELLMASDR